MSYILLQELIRENKSLDCLLNFEVLSDAEILKLLDLMLQEKSIAKTIRLVEYYGCFTANKDVSSVSETDNKLASILNALKRHPQVKDKLCVNTFSKLTIQ
jgi:hypothetical protein